MLKYFTGLPVKYLTSKLNFDSEHAALSPEIPLRGESVNQSKVDKLYNQQTSKSEKQSRQSD
jgi:hypothetical protein